MVMGLAAIAGFRLVTADPERLGCFYAAIGFAMGGTVPIGADEMAVLGLTGTGRRLSLTLGATRLDLDSFSDGGRPYPAESNAADLCFQHLALVTDDADAAWSRASAAGATAISRGGPVTLPASAGGVTAIKFRDPDGHPLEFLRFSDGADRGWRGTGVLGIDHSAIAVADVAASIAFYEAHGLSEGDRTLNHGPMQVALDGLDEVAVDVVPLEPREATPHVELLGYRHPHGRSFGAPDVGDIAATRIVWRSDRDALLRDPDGHLHQLARG